jgi:hypothetical protein
MTLADCREGSVVRMWSGEEVMVELVNLSRARIRPIGYVENTFPDPKTGTMKTVRSRRPARDVAPTAEILAVLGSPSSEC